LQKIVKFSTDPTGKWSSPPTRSLWLSVLFSLPAWSGKIRGESAQEAISPLRYLASNGP